MYPLLVSYFYFYFFCLHKLVFANWKTGTQSNRSWSKKLSTVSRGYEDVLVMILLLLLYINNLKTKSRSITLLPIRKYLELCSSTSEWHLRFFFFNGFRWFTLRSLFINDYLSRIHYTMWLYLLLIFTSMRRSTTRAHAQLHTDSLVYGRSNIEIKHSFDLCSLHIHLITGR